MLYEFYLDVYLVENFVMNYVLLRMIKRLLACSATPVRSFVCAACSALIATVSFVFLYSYGVASTLLVSVAANTLMVRFGCKIQAKRTLVRGMLLYSMGLAGFGMAFTTLRRFTGEEGVYAFLKTTVISYTLIRFCIWLYEKVKVWRKSYKVTLYQDGKSKEVKGLYDTGNMLWDTTLQQHVSVINISLIQDLCSEEISRELEAFCARKLASAEILRTLQPHYIPYRCVGCEAGMLPVITLDAMRLEWDGMQKMIVRPVLAIDRSYSSSLQSYQMILNPNLIDS